MRHFRLLVVGNGISAYGSYLNMVALNVFVYDVTDSALAAGTFMAVRLLTSVVSGFVSGRLVSAHDRKILMVGADLTQCAAMIALLIAPDGGRAGLLYVLAVVTGFCSTLSGVALRSSIPEIVGGDLRLRANSLLATGRSLAMIAGFASAGVVVAQLGYVAAISLDAATFAVSACVLLSLPIRTRARADEGASTGDSKGDSGRRGVGAMLLLRATPVLAVMIALRAADGLGSSSHNVALPVYSSDLDPSHPATFVSQFWATWAIGNIVMQQVCGRWAGRGGRQGPGERAFAVGACVMSAAFIVVFAGLPTYVAVAAALVAGMADGLTEIAYVTRLQAAPDAQRGRLFGLSASVENTGFGLGMLVSGALLDRFSPFHVVGMLHGLAIALCFGMFVVLVRQGRRAASGDPLPEVVREPPDRRGSESAERESEAPR
ncbi:MULTISPECIES: MFS transporter [unclassified Streptomyces]|uniref:MFS transporter n=1 Tax=unclassified Streptomyces TaxID=2593676 RepID=UPI00136FFAC0|nr:MULTISPECIES: MFS transporter [unclassified Streptomyces]NEA05267.1 MFS transporter [Streptomyces sp. SID10116]MYY83305.1 MFS transporter [Streptomyces sp. SID335]MYZ14345.1 MFS transporter [Streptomyces sp. SID337]NDZ86729.1 MFS transporter [Streptomyces sp. SID10115]NEB49403.1 MFS transporter [Streptomyces sp. SID339]